MLLFPGIFPVHYRVCFSWLLREDSYFPCPRIISKGLVLHFHGSAGYFLCLISSHIWYVCSLPIIGVKFSSCVVYIISELVAIGNFIVHFHCIGVTPPKGTLSFLLLPLLVWTPWSLSPISSCVLSALLIIYLVHLGLYLVAPSCDAWPSSAFGPLYCCCLVGLLLLLVVRCGYINCDRQVVYLVLFLLC